MFLYSSKYKSTEISLNQALEIPNQAPIFGYYAGVTGTVGFDGLTGATGAGSICLSSTKELVYNAGSDACLPSLRSTKHDINNLSTSSLSTLNLLTPVSFIYNQGDNRTRYGFIAEDVSQIDTHLATYNDKGEISGIDDRALIALAIGSIKELDVRSNVIASSTIDLDLKVQALSASTTDMDTIVSSTTLALVTNQDLLNIISTSTALILKTNNSFIDSIANAVKNIIAVAGEWMVTKISATLGVFESVESKNVISDLVKSNSVETNTVNSDSVKSNSLDTSTINTQTASISNGLQITDKITGQIYCVSLKNGDWDKTVGQCSEISTTTEIIKQPLTTILPFPEPIITTLPTPTLENQTEETSTTTPIVNATTTETILISEPTPTPTPVPIPIQDTEIQPIDTANPANDTSPTTEVSGESVSVSSESVDSSPTVESSGTN